MHELNYFIITIIAGTWNTLDAKCYTKKTYNATISLLRQKLRKFWHKILCRDFNLDAIQIWRIWLFSCPADNWQLLVGPWDNLDRGFPKLSDEDPHESLCIKSLCTWQFCARTCFWSILNHSKMFIFWNIQEFSISWPFQNFHILEDFQMITFLIILTHSGPYRNFHI